MTDLSAWLRIDQGALLDHLTRDHRLEPAVAELVGAYITHRLQHRLTQHRLTQHADAAMLVYLPPAGHA